VAAIPNTKSLQKCGQAFKSGVKNGSFIAAKCPFSPSSSQMWGKKRQKWGKSRQFRAEKRQF